jgi:hypothetical protein
MRHAFVDNYYSGTPGVNNNSGSGAIAITGYTGNGLALDGVDFGAGQGAIGQSTSGTGLYGASGSSEHPLDEETGFHDVIHYSSYTRTGTPPQKRRAPFGARRLCL